MAPLLNRYDHLYDLVAGLWVTLNSFRDNQVPRVSKFKLLFPPTSLGNCELMNHRVFGEFRCFSSQ